VIVGAQSFSSHVLHYVTRSIQNRSFIKAITELHTMNPFNHKCLIISNSLES